MCEYPSGDMIFNGTVAEIAVCVDNPGDVIDAAAYSVNELREAVFEGRGRLARPLALGLLTRKDYPEKVVDLQRVLTSEREVPRLRAMAAAALGDVQTPAALEALEHGLQTREVLTLRSVAKALGRVGTAEHIRALENLAARPDAVGPEAERALRALTDRLKRGPSDAPSLRRLPLVIRIDRPDDRDLAEVLKAVKSDRLTPNGSISIECQGRALIFVFDEQALGSGIRLLKERGEIGLVAEQRRVEGTGWEPRYRVVIEPTAQSYFEISITTIDGRPVIAGNGQVEDEAATFHMAAVDTPGAPLIDIRGRFDGLRLTFERAFSAARRRPGKQPVQTRRVPQSD